MGLYDGSWIALSTAALRLKMSYQRVMTRVQTGELEGQVIAGRWRVKAESVEAYAEKQRNGQEASA